MKCKPKIITKNFNDIKEDDYILGDISFLGDFERFVLFPVQKIGYTLLHNHKYIIINDEKYFKDDRETFKVLVLEMQG